MFDSDFLLVYKLLSREFSYHVLSFVLLLYHDSVNAKKIPEKSTSSAVARDINSTKQKITVWQSTYRSRSKTDLAPVKRRVEELLQHIALIPKAF